MKKPKLYYMDTDTCIAYIKTDNIYKDITENVETRFGNQIDRYQKKKKVIGLMKDGLGGKIMTRFVGLRAKPYRYLVDGRSKDKKSKRHKKVCHKKKT